MKPDGNGAAFPISPVDVPPDSRAAVDITSAAAAVPSGVAVPSDNGGGGSPNSSLIRIHGRLMIIAFAAVFPLGILIGRLIHPPSASNTVIGDSGGRSTFLVFLAHALLQTAGTALVAVSFALIVHRFKDGLHAIHEIPLRHGSVGVAATSLVFAQFLLGTLLRPSLGVSRRRRAWELSHALLGRAAVAVGLTNVFLGIQIASNFGVLDKSRYHTWLGLSAASAAFFWLIGGSVEKALVQRVRLREAAATPRVEAGSGKEIA